MSEAKLVREHETSRRGANPLEKALGLRTLVERQPSSEAQTPKPTGVPAGIAARLTRWIPTETIALYVAFLALLTPLVVSRQEDACRLNSFTGRWIALGAFAAASCLLALLLHVAKVRRTHEPFRWPVWEMVVAPVAFAAWALALPDTPLYSACGYDAEVGGFIVLAVTVTIGVIAEALGKQPPETEN
jgi:hypothetical protein